LVDIERGDPESPLSPAELEAEALFEEARRRRRRRAAALGGAVLAIAVAGVAVLSSPRGRTPARDGGPVAVAPGQVLAKGGASMGVACPRPNSIACDRVGIAVETRRPARAVQATVAGRAVRLDDPEWSGRSRHGLRRWFAGFLQPAGLLGHGPLAVQVEDGRYYWTGVHPAHATVRLVITYADGSQKATALRVSLSPGWG
jgi:hypothetical protein